MEDYKWTILPLIQSDFIHTGAPKLISSQYTSAEESWQRTGLVSVLGSFLATSQYYKCTTQIWLVNQRTSLTWSPIMLKYGLITCNSTLMWRSLTILLRARHTYKSTSLDNLNTLDITCTLARTMLLWKTHGYYSHWITRISHIVR